jgi:hypothetical protein
MSEPIPITIHAIGEADETTPPGPEPDVAIAEAVADVLASLVAVATEAIEEISADRGVPDAGGSQRLLRAGSGLAIDAIRTLGTWFGAVERSLVSVSEENAVARAVAAHGRSTWQRETERDDDVARASLQAVAEAILDRLDLTALVGDHLDVDAVAAQVDPDPIVARMDVDAMLARIDVNELAARIDVGALAEKIDMEALIERVDLPGLASAVIEELDLPELIRETAGDTASDEVRQVRLRSVDADRAVQRAVDRVLGRKRQP